MKRLAVFLPLLASSGVYAFEATPYIVNGTQANIANYPSFSSLYFDNGRFYGNFCGSTIINSEYILTAAHCIYGDYNRMLHTWAVPQVTNESGYLNGDYESVRAVEFYYPDGYVHSSLRNGQTTLRSSNLHALYLEHRTTSASLTLTMQSLHYKERVGIRRLVMV